MVTNVPANAVKNNNNNNNDVNEAGRDAAPAQTGQEPQPSTSTGETGVNASNYDATKLKSPKKEWILRYGKKSS